MMDVSPLIPKGFHFADWNRRYTEDGVRTTTEWCERASVKSLQYYIIDFGISTHFPGNNNDARAIGTYGQDRSVPEHSKTIPWNPFKSDIYQLGNAMLQVMDVRPLFNIQYSILTHFLFTSPAV